MSFSDFVKKARAELGVTQRQLAADLQISYVTVNRWEREHSTPNALTRVSFVNYCQARGIAVPAEIAVSAGADDGSPSTGAFADLCTVSETALYLRLSRGTIYNLLKGGGLSALKTGGQWFIPRAELERYRSERQHPGK
ncbi:MAG: helix-turn-helix domain-containing protein [Gracilibacteraceae bacterium]|nr:helix-turn-helix domain-containing protein [Gracilibacteraceae bacterium]